MSGWVNILRFEWKHFVRSAHEWMSALLFALAVSYIGYVLFEDAEARAWLGFWWMIFIFISLQSFYGAYRIELNDRPLYFYTLTSALHVFVGKLIAQLIKLLILSGITTAALAFFLGWPILHLDYFIVSWVIISISLSLVLNIASALAVRGQKGGGGIGLVALPLIIPVLLSSLRMSLQSITPTASEWDFSELALPSAIVFILISISLLVFPLLWRD